MANIYRLSFTFLLLLLCAVPAFAALPPPVSATRYAYSAEGVSSGFTYSSLDAACAAAMPLFTNSAGVATSYSSSPPANCGVTIVRRSDNYLYYGYPSIGFQSALTCGTNQGLSNGVCTCDSGFTERDGQCVPLSPTCDWAKGQTQMIFGTFQIERGKQLCSSGCAFVLKSDAGIASESARANASSPWFDTRTMGDYVGSGSVCDSATTGASTGDSTPSPYPPGEDGTPPKDKCPPGKVPGSVNGLFVCVTPGETSSHSDKTKTEKKPDPNDPTGPPSETKTATSTNTQCDGSKCTTTTTTTTTPPTGPPTTKTETTEQDKKSFCDENPNLSICKTTSFSGSCGSAPSCEGDAIQCAMAADQIARNCKIFDDHSTSEEALFNSEKNKEGSVTGNLPGNETVSIGPGNFDTSDAIGLGVGCITDKVITVVGQSVTVPFSRVCAYLSMLGNALVLFSFVLAGRIVGRG